MKIHENPPFLDACPTKTSIYFRDVPAMFEDTGYHQFLTCVQLPRGQRRPPPSNPWSFEMPPATSGAGSGATGVNQSRPVTRVPHMYKLVLGSAWSTRNLWWIRLRKKNILVVPTRWPQAPTGQNCSCLRKCNALCSFNTYVSTCAFIHTLNLCSHVESLQKIVSTKKREHRGMPPLGCIMW
jgi:hypothetical protein